MAQISVDRDGLALVKERMEREQEQRELDREARREELQKEKALRIQELNTTNELELEKLKLMMGVFC